MSSMKFLKANWEEVPEHLLQEQRGDALAVNKVVAIKRAWDYIEALELQVKDLERKQKWLVDEMFIGVQLMEGSIVGNYLQWVKSLRPKLEDMKREWEKDDDNFSQK